MFFLYISWKPRELDVTFNLNNDDNLWLEWRPTKVIYPTPTGSQENAFKTQQIQEEKIDYEEDKI